MNGKQIGLSLVLADFTALSGWALYEQGFAGMIEIATSSPMGITLAVDLVLALSMLTAWIWKDAKAHGMNPLPYALLTASTGSVGPLLYFIRRESARAEGAAVRAPSLMSA